MNMKYLLTAISLFVLTSCGGGGGGGAPAGGAPASSNFNGVAVDGYLYQARAFLDLNGNGQYDSGEPTATTDTNGGFTLSATQDQINSHSVVVSAIAGTTIDQDNPNTPLASGMTLVAPAGNPSVVSPLTTQVSAKMAGGLSLADAKSAVQTELGLPSIDVMKNFVAEKATNAAYADAHKVAASVAEVLKNIETQSSANTTLANRFSSLTTTVTSQVAPNVTQIKAAASVDDAKTVMTTAISQSVNIYSIGGSISGLTASGLVLANGVGTVSPSSGANSFIFSSRRASGASYAVTVQSNPTGQVCTVSNGSGSVGSQSISSVSISCSNTPGALGGTISGLTTAGLILKNGSDELTVASGSSTFQFSSTVADGATYAVTVKTQPTGKTCSVSSGSGTMVSAGITNVQVTCSSNSYSISGSISGLTTSGLKLKNGAEVLTVSSGATTFGFSNSVAYGGTYSVSIDTQPTGHTCSLSNSSGTMGAANLSAVQVTCSVNAYSLSGTISGLNASGLKLKNGSEVLTISSGATTFAFSANVAFGGSYSVSVDTQPSGYTCSLSNEIGSIGASNVSNISLSCISNTPNILISPPSIPNPVGSTLDVEVKLDKQGYGYWLVQPAALTAPTLTEVLAAYLRDPSGLDGLAGRVALSANQAQTFRVSPLLYSTQYKLYFAASSDGSILNSTTLATSSFTSPPPAITTLQNAATDFEEACIFYGQSTITNCSALGANGRYYYWLNQVPGSANIRYRIYYSDDGKVERPSLTLFVGAENAGRPTDGVGTQAIFSSVRAGCYSAAVKKIFVIDFLVDAGFSQGIQTFDKAYLRSIDVDTKEVVTIGSPIDVLSGNYISMACTDESVYFSLKPSYSLYTFYRFDIVSKKRSTILYPAPSTGEVAKSNDGTKIYIGSGIRYLAIP
jgi:hypothetical protein